MIKFKKLSIQIITFSFFLLSILNSAPVTIYPGVEQRAFKNPLKGFRPSLTWGDPWGHPYGALAKHYIAWKDLENNASDNLEKIINYCNTEWANVEDSNIKVIPRVYLDYPSRPSGWPDDMTTGDYTSTQFFMRLSNFIQKLGQAWDNDSRVAYIEMGIIGQWGEHHAPAPDAFQMQVLGDLFTNHFRNKYVMTRQQEDGQFSQYTFGVYWDSWAHWDQVNHENRIMALGDRWLVNVIGGECAYDWGSWQTQPGQDPDDSLQDPVHRDYILDRIRRLHCNHLGWIDQYDRGNTSSQAGAAIMQKAFGYRFVIPEFTYDGRVEPGGTLNIDFDVINNGSSQFYYYWPLEISLLNTATHQPVWQEQFTTVDIRTWLPGNNWNDGSDTYTTPALTYNVTESFTIPAGLAAGEYTVALAILDPAGDRPSARFAISNYYNGGRHPMGKIGIGTDVAVPQLSSFDNILSDNSLNYDVEVSTNLSTQVYLILPAPGATFYEYTSMVMSAEVVFNQSAVDRVEFYEGGSKLGEDTSAPYFLTWDDLPQGSHSITAKAIIGIDEYSSTPVNISVIPSPFPNVTNFTVTPLTTALDLDWTIMTNGVTGTSAANQLNNPDFSSGTSSWNLWLNGGVTASLSETGGEGHIAISSGGSGTWEVSLSQTGVSLSNGVEYTMTAWMRCASGSKTVDFKVRMPGGAFTIYHEENPVLTTTMTKYEYTFTMTDPTDNNVQFMIDCGGDNNDIYIDDLSLSSGGAALTSNLGPALVRVTRQAGSYPLTPFEGTVVYDTLGTNHLDSGLTPGVTYYYAAFARWTNLGTALYSSYAPYAAGSGIPLAGSTPPPAQPGTPTVYSTNSNSIDISWTDLSTNEDGFYIYLDISNVIPPSPLYTNTAGDNTVRLDGLSEGELYYFWIAAWNAGGLSAASVGSFLMPVTSTSNTNTTNVILPPAAPGIPTVIASNSNSFTVSWADLSTNEDGFYIYLNTVNILPAVPSFTNSGGITSLLFDSLADDTHYYFWISAFNSAGVSAPAGSDFYLPPVPTNQTNTVEPPPVADTSTNFMILPGIINPGDRIVFKNIRYDEALKTSSVRVYNLNGDILYRFKEMVWRQVGDEYYADVGLDTDTPTALGVPLSRGIYFLQAGSEVHFFTVK